MATGIAPLASITSPSARRRIQGWIRLVAASFSTSVRSVAAVRIRSSMPDRPRTRSRTSATNRFARSGFRIVPSRVSPPVRSRVGTTATRCAWIRLSTSPRRVWSTHSRVRAGTPVRSSAPVTARRSTGVST
ncbi:hypothetical protein [Methylobacterium oryzihabitans]|uniref:hypothetical protein n=1 Tax=Methylobacterium oryzihabitans TaxID=2499852 RepID=UPI001FE253E9|nr:hypothetical protein [Methylobacterium oryzihabitans]